MKRGRIWATFACAIRRTPAHIATIAEMFGAGDVAQEPIVHFMRSLKGSPDEKLYSAALGHRPRAARACVRAHTHRRIHTYTPTRLHTYTPTHLHACTCRRTLVHSYSLTHSLTHSFTYLHACARKHTYDFRHAHAHMRTCITVDTHTCRAHTHMRLCAKGRLCLNRCRTRLS